MKKLLAPIGLAFSLIAGCVGLLGQSTAVNQVGAPTNTIGAPADINVPLSGQNSCSITTNTAGSFSAQPRTSNDQSNWTNVGSAISTSTTTTVAINSSTQAIGFFQLHITAVTGPLTYTIVCNLSGGGSGGGAGGTVVVSSLPPVVISSLPPIVTSQATCPGAPNAPCTQITGIVTVNTAPPYVAPTCPGAPSAPCVQVTGTVPVSGAFPTPIPFPSPYPTAPAGQGGGLWVNDGGTTATTLTSSSATACTNIIAAPTTLFSIGNAGPAQIVFMQFYNDAAATCAAATLVWGDGTTVVMGAGQVITLRYPLSAGLAYKINSALTSNVVVVTK